MAKHQYNCPCLDCNPAGSVTKELETLNYRNKECPANPSSAPMGFNSVVVKPETRVNKTENVGQHIQESLCRREAEPEQRCNDEICVSCKTDAMGKCPLTEQPKEDKGRKYGNERDEMSSRFTAQPNQNLGREFTEKVAEIFNVPTGLEPQIRTGHCPKCGQDWRTHDSSCEDNRASVPNQNLMIITEIEGLMSQVNDKIGELIGKKANEHHGYIRHTATIVSKALEEIDLFQKTTLFDLRKAFE